MTTEYVLRVDRRRFEKAPCYICGYNGEKYYQPGTHPCASMYHAAAPALPAVDDANEIEHPVVRARRLERECELRAAALSGADETMKQRAGIYVLQTGLPINAEQLAGILNAALSGPTAQEEGK